MGNSEPSADAAWHENQLLLAPVLALWANPDCGQPVVPNRFHFVMIPLTFVCRIFSSEEASGPDLLHR